MRSAFIGRLSYPEEFCFSFATSFLGESGAGVAGAGGGGVGGLGW